MDYQRKKKVLLSTLHRKKGRQQEKKKMTFLTIYGKVMFSILILLGLFFFAAALLMWTWNYTVPRLAASVDIAYVRETTFTNLDYITAVVFLILLAILFTPITLGAVAQLAVFVFTSLALDQAQTSRKK